MDNRVRWKGFSDKVETKLARKLIVLDKFSLLSFHCRLSFPREYNNYEVVLEMREFSRKLNTWKIN